MTTSQVRFKHARRQRRRDPRLMELDARACESDDFTPIGRTNISDIDSLTTHARCLKIRQNSLLAFAWMHRNISLYRRVWLVTNPGLGSRLIVDYRRPQCVHYNASSTLRPNRTKLELPFSHNARAIPKSRHAFSTVASRITSSGQRLHRATSAIINFRCPGSFRRFATTFDRFRGRR